MPSKVTPTESRTNRRLNKKKKIKNPKRIAGEKLKNGPKLNEDRSLTNTNQASKL